jgi:chromate transport protein ChrA
VVTLLGISGVLAIVGAILTLLVWRKSRNRSQLYSALGGVLVAAFALHSLLDLNGWFGVTILFSAAAVNWYGVYLARKESQMNHGKVPH